MPLLRLKLSLSKGIIIGPEQVIVEGVMQRHALHHLPHVHLHGYTRGVGLLSIEPGWLCLIIKGDIEELEGELSFHQKLRQDLPPLSTLRDKGEHNSMNPYQCLGSISGWEDQVVGHRGPLLHLGHLLLGVHVSISQVFCQTPDPSGNLTPPQASATACYHG